MKYVDNFEDAKRFLEKDIDGAYDRRLKKVARLQALFIGGLGNAVLLGVSLATNQMGNMAFAIPLLAWAANAYTSVIRRSIDKKRIENGNYFKYTKPEKVIAQANKQIAAANAEEEKGMKH